MLLSYVPQSDRTTLINEAPVASAASARTDEDVAVQIALAGSDPDGDALTYAIVSPPAHGTLSTVDGDKVTYTPVAGYNGPDSFSFKANDGMLDSAPATVSVVVSRVNHAPIAVNDAVVEMSYVDTTNHTISGVTDSFSPYMIGQPLSEESSPEPVTNSPASSDWSLVLLGIGALAMLIRHRRLAQVWRMQEEAVARPLVDSAMLKVTARFAVIFGLFDGVIFLLASRTTAIFELCVATARMATWLIGLFGMSASQNGIDVVISNRILRIGGDCSGVFLAALFCSLILAYPVTWRTRWMGILGGLAALVVANLARLVAVAFLSVAAPSVFQVAHDFFFQVGMVLVLLAVWAAWLAFARRHVA